MSSNVKSDSTVAKVRNLGLVDLDTGEVLQKNVYVIGKHGQVDTGYIKVFVTFLSDIIADKEITGKAVRLLLYLVERLDWNSLRIYFVPKEVIKDLKITEQTFYQWLKILKDKEILIKVSPNVYELNANSFIRGSLVKALEEKEKKKTKKSG